MDDSAFFTIRNRSHSYGMIGLNMADSISNFTSIQGDSSVPVPRLGLHLFGESLFPCLKASTTQIKGMVRRKTYNYVNPTEVLEYLSHPVLAKTLLSSNTFTGQYNYLQAQGDP